MSVAGRCARAAGAVSGVPNKKHKGEIIGMAKMTGAVANDG
jgi:hypothetical protein